VEVPTKLAELAQTCLTASQDVGDAWSEARVGLQVPSGAAGNTPGGAEVLAAHVAAGDAAATAVGRLVAVLEADVDAVYLCAFDFATTDEAVASGLESMHPLPPEPSTPSPGPAPSPTPPPTDEAA